MLIDNVAPARTNQIDFGDHSINLSTLLDVVNSLILGKQFPVNNASCAPPNTKHSLFMV